MIDFFSKLKDNRIFQFSVVVIIILNAILIGATTYQLDPIFLNTIHLLDYAITAVSYTHLTLPTRIFV